MMACTTVKEGKSCVFMKKAGCSYLGGACHPIVETCNGCENLEKYPAGDFCKIFSEPALKWLGGACNMATHVKKASDEEQPVKKVNPLKASKRAQR